MSKDESIHASDLESVALFQPLPNTALEFLAARLQPSRYQAGATVFSEDDDGADVYIVLEGEVEVLKRGRTGRDTRVAMLGPKDAFGEMSMIDEAPRSATVRTLGPTRLLCFSHDDFDALHQFDVKSYATIVRNVARDLAKRLRVADRLLADFSASLQHDYVNRAKNQ
ncbi:MAG: cyclic nucleotide-binding domain-containing protein [Polyangiaceae bacterium]|nr:cyclic nucleotide-binding domain-containing protein [Polyangiaceae bacterium]